MALNKQVKDRFAEEFPKAVNDYELNVHFLISIREDYFAKLDYFKEDIQDLLKNRKISNPLMGSQLEKQLKNQSMNIIGRKLYWTICLTLV